MTEREEAIRVSRIRRPTKAEATPITSSLRSVESLSHSDGAGRAGSTGTGTTFGTGLMRGDSLGETFRLDLRFLGCEKRSKMNILQQKNYSTNGLFSLRYN